MKNINITVENKRAAVVGSPVIVCGNSDYTVTFAFDNEWSLTGPKTARFVYVKRGEVMHEDVLFDGNTVAVPVLSDVTFVNVGVFAGDLCTTTPARVNCHPSILCGSGIVQAPTPDVYAQIMALFEGMAEKGAFGATEEQMQLVEQNRQDIAALEAGTKKAGDAEKLGGQEASYFATAQSVTDLENGTKKAGKAKEADNASKLGGYGADGFMPARPTTLTSSIKEKANSLPDGTYFYHLGGTGYTGNDLPSTNWYYGSALIVKRNQNSIEIVLFTESGKTAVSAYNGQAWTDWKVFASEADLAKYLPLTGGKIDGTGYFPLEINGTSSYNENYIRLSSNGIVLGSLGFYGANNPRFVSTDGVASPLLHTGNMASHVLPLSGGGIVAKNGTKVMGVHNTNSVYTLFEFYGQNAELGSVGFDGVNNLIFRPVESGTKQIHHDGNSAKVHIGTSAPSDTSAVWFDTSSL